MSHQALYRKYRSQTFGELVGQDHVVRTLRHAIEQGKISQAYLFTGPRGTGKTSTARLMAKALNCTGGPSADIPEDCPICAEITAGTCMDVVEIDAASEAGVDNVREHIVQASEYQPTYCRYRIFIIDEVHDLSPKAFDALLKTIEEPPAHVVFILATTEYNKVPPTIRSRCQKFEFHRGTIQDLVSRLGWVAEQEGVVAEPAALTAIARMADGGYRDALTLFEQAMITGEGQITLAHVYDQLGLVGDETADGLIEAIAVGDVKGIVEKTEAIYRTGRDPQSIVESLLHRLSDLTRTAYQVTEGASGDSAVEAGLTATAGRLGAEKILAIRGAVSTTHKAVRDVSLPRLWLEAELVRISQELLRPAVAASVPGSVSVPGSGGGAVQSGQPVQQTVPQTVPQPRQPVQPAAREERVVVSTPAAVQLDPVKGTVGGSGEVGVTASGDEGVWQKVVAALSAVSKTAGMRLPKSRVWSVADGVVTVTFDRVVDAEWVGDSVKVHQAIIQEWKKASGEERVFRFVGPQSGQPAKAAPKVEKASVESPLEGEPLAKEIKSVFEVEGGATNDETS